MTKVSHKYDLEERTGKFAELIILFCKKIPENTITRPIISQLVRSGTSVAANYCEADLAESKRDFKHKISICNKEAKETKHWLKMIIITTPELKNDALSLKKEAAELNLIFSSIIISIKRKSQNFGI